MRPEVLRVFRGVNSDRYAAVWVAQWQSERSARQELWSPKTGDHRSTEDQVNMQATLPQRIDCVGSKVEELAGTGVPDSPGG